MQGFKGLSIFILSAPAFANWLASKQGRRI